MKLAAKGGQEAHIEGNRLLAIPASNTANFSIIGANFHVNKTGYYNVLLSGDDTPVKLWLIAGMIYPYRIKRLFVTDTEHTDGLIGVTSVDSADDKA